MKELEKMEPDATRVDPMEDLLGEGSLLTIIKKTT